VLPEEILEEEIYYFKELEKKRIKP